MKNIIILMAAAGGVYLLLNSGKARATPLAGRQIIGTDGRVFTLTRQNDGLIRDQVGGLWT